MRRLAGATVISALVHAAVLVWVAGALTRWRERATQEAPAAPPVSIEVDPLASPGSRAGSGAGSRGATTRPHHPRRRIAAGTGSETGTAAETGTVSGAESVAATGGATGPGTGVGAGTGTVPGTGSGAGAAPSPDLARLIQARIQAHRRYPLLARRQGLEGTVELTFRVGQDGSVYDLHVVRSAGPLFDQAATSAVQSAIPLPPCSVPVRVPIRFRLTEERAIR
ncbi:MAG TPA: energy transducer TonB [Polyangia bacterium]|nr:energy transducer TonB [Polyangia bacterium]